MLQQQKKKPTLNPPLDPSKFATSKYSWEELKDIIINERFPILRHVDHETTYRLYSQKLKRQWKSVYDFVLHCKFDFEKRLIPRDVEDENKSEVKMKSSNGSSSADVVAAEDVELEVDIPTLPYIESPPRGYVWESFAAHSQTRIKNPQRALVMNDFPYYIEDGIEHWCLWKLGDDDVNEIDIKWAKEELNRRSDVVEMMHWINPVHLKSLPGIDHAHILCLKQKR